MRKLFGFDESGDHPRYLFCFACDFLHLAICDQADPASDVGLGSQLGG
jgi:hypothetical protein